MTAPLPALMDAETGEAGKGRSTIRPALADAVRLMVMQGYTITEAAEAVKMKRRSLVIALRKPHVAAHLADVKRAWMDNRTSKAWVNVAELADKACSEDVRLKANRVFLEAAGELGGKGQDPNANARTLVQIVLNQAQQAGQPLAERMPGVFEPVPYQPLTPNQSNSRTVGRADSDEEAG